MAREATIRVSLNVVANDAGGVLNFKSTPVGYTMNVEARKGPLPGSLTVSVDGTNVDFSQLVTPTLCLMMNQDNTNFVTYGIKDFDTDTFYPLGELPPGGMPIFLVLSRLLLVEYPGTGTGVPATQNTLHMKADHAPCNVLVYAFEK